MLQCRWRWIFSKSRGVICKVHWNTKTVIPGKFPVTTGMFKTHQLFPQTCSTHTNMYAYLPIFISYWNMQEYSDSHLFRAGHDRFCGHFAFSRHDIKLAIFCIAHLNCIFQGASFGLIKKSGNFDSRNVTRFLRNPPIPLLHPT